MPLALPKVYETNPWRTSSRLASKTARRRSGSSIASSVTLLRAQFRWQKVYIGERIDEARDGVDRNSAGRYDSPDIHGPDLSFCKLQKIMRVTLSCPGNDCQETLGLSRVNWDRRALER